MSNENKQPDERAAFEAFWSGVAEMDPNEEMDAEEIASAAFSAGASFARATQQATKGDQTAIAERCAQFAELYRKEHATSRDAEEACTEIAEACRQYATTPFPVAGSAGQAPIAEIRNVDNPDFEGEQYVHMVLTQAQLAAIQNALRWIPRHLEPEMHDALGELSAAQPTEQRMSDAARFADLLRGWYDASAKGTVMVEDVAYRLVTETAEILHRVDTVRAGARKAEIERNSQESK